jgi:hypothetical protein
MVVPDTQNGAVRTVTGPSCRTDWTVVTGEVDLGGDPTVSIIDGDEFVTGNPLKVHVAPGKLEVGVADADGANPEEDLARPGLRTGEIVPQPEGRGVTGHGEHGVGPSPRGNEAMSSRRDQESLENAVVATDNWRRRKGLTSFSRPAIGLDLDVL